MSPENQTVPEGRTANFTCKAKGIPRPAVDWSFNDGALPKNASASYSDEGSLLQLSSTTKDMEGIYKCTATNKANATSTTATLGVLGEHAK